MRTNVVCVAMILVSCLSACGIDPSDDAGSPQQTEAELGGADAPTRDAAAGDAAAGDAAAGDAAAGDAAAGDAPSVDAGCQGEPEPECPAAPDGMAPQDPGIPGGGRCRGACGAACPSTCRTAASQSVCLEWQTADCRWHAKVCTYPVIECGSHDGCRTHDACYDQCVGATFPSWCRRQCDYDCVDEHGTANCNAWRQGDPPYDSWLSFAGTPASSTYDSTCY